MLLFSLIVIIRRFVHRCVTDGSCANGTRRRRRGAVMLRGTPAGDAMIPSNNRR